MKRAITTLFIIIASLLPTLARSGETKYVEGFSSCNIGGFPKGWRTRPGSRDTAEKIYSVQEEAGDKYLSANDKEGDSVQIFKLAHWDLEKYPIFQWRWRAKKLPAGANETIPAKNDSACGLYVSFGLIRGKALKYVWSTSAPAGTFYKKDDNMHIIVKRSGHGGLGRWVNESTNILEDSKKAFGEVPDKTLSGIAILTDGNATKTESACDYDNIGYGSLEK